MPGLWPGILRFAGGVDDWADGVGGNAVTARAVEKGCRPQWRRS